MQPYTTADFSRNPMMFYYETTQACDLECRHCRASAQKEAAEGELVTEQSLALLKQIASFDRKPHLVLTGGDPLKRKDLFTLIRFAVDQGLEVALTPSATPLATREALAQAKAAGVRAFGFSLDASNAETHDAFRGLEGSFAKTWELLRWARELEVPVQVNTTISRRNVDQIDEMAQELADFGIAMWSLFFLIPVGRGVEEHRISPVEYESVFAKIYAHARKQPYAIKTCEAPHYRRWVLQHGDHPLHVRRNVSDAATVRRPMHRAPLGVGDGKGIMFVSHRGEICPAGFLPIVCGRFPADSVVDIYRNHPVFQAIRSPDQFHGNCGRCEYRYVCGGSRSRAFAVTGDYMASEPDCIYVPNEKAVLVLP
ncbi:MAG: TIGR04053 family radical SAM/SPASM domain-containing protein [Thermoguttaceae bacterium]|nr:TIGR04053 family radical SAM/SPASM domain-containing protein [Thermoguttaceae bacterium]